MYKFTIYGECVGKKRPKFSRQGNFVRTYTPTETTNYENLVRLSFIQENPNFKTIDKDTPLMCVITIYKEIPKSTSKKKREQMLSREIRPTTKPDLDNVVKSILDGLNKVAFADDSQIATLFVEKFYGDTPRVEVKIMELNPFGRVGTMILLQSLINKLFTKEENEDVDFKEEN